ncbi:hypothetical protein HDU96_011074 [Phlyctochytrium bullatum]|nr:hypothetical protein HDU96_011074 [Phlyctochytrium bullatum]
MLTGNDDGDDLPIIETEHVQIGAHAGYGASGVVQKCIARLDEGTVKVAVKQIPFDKNNEKKRREVLLHESKVLASLKHDRVVRFHGMIVGSYLGIVMELEKLLPRKRKTTLSLRVCIALDVAEAMKYIHSWDLIHTDLKSANILLHLGIVPGQANDGLSILRAKVCDFGLAKTKKASELGPASGTPVLYGPGAASEGAGHA